MPSSKKSASDNLSKLEQELLKSTSDPVADWTLSQIGLQIDIIRSNRDQNSLGSVFFSAKDFDRVIGLADYVSQNKYTHPALIPEMTWKPGSVPGSPQNLRSVEIENEYYISWDFPAGQNDRFAIYTTTKITDPGQIIHDPVNLKEITFQNYFPLKDLDFSNGSNIVVTAITPTGKESAPSSLFELDIEFPLIEELLPIYGDTVSIRDLLSWRSDTSGAVFNVHVSGNSLFSNLVYDSPWIADSQVNIENLSLEGETGYFWRVKARTDIEGPYSETMKIITGFPQKPILNSPENLAQNISTQPTVKWSASSVTDSVKVMISQSASFDPILFEEMLPAGPGQGKLSTELDKDTWYYLKIMGVNEYGYSNFTDFRTFRTTLGEIPDVRAIEPEDGATAASDDYFRWETLATTGNISYILEVALDREFNSIMSASGWITDEEIRIDRMNLEGDRSYFWRVKAKSEFGESEYTNTLMFYAGYPARPRITSPAQLSENNDVRAVIEWTADNITDSVLVEFSRSSEFETLEYSEKFTVSASPAQINHSLQEFTWYFARIRAENEYGYSIYSANKYFQTGESNTITEVEDKLIDATLYPNPFKEGDLILKFRNHKPLILYIDIFDLTGREIGRMEGTKFPEGEHHVRIENFTKNMKPGYYFFKIKTGKNIKTLKLIKLDK